MEPRDEIRDPMGSTGSSGEAHRMKEQTKEAARNVADQAREASSRLAGRAREQANRVVGQRKDDAAHSLDSLSSALRDSAGRLRGEQSVFGDYAESAAERVERLARYLRDSQPEQFLRDAEDFARRRPEIFVGGMFVAGLLLARFLKSSSRYAEGGEYAYTGGTGGPGGGTGAEVGRRADVDTAWQPESGAYGGSSQGPGTFGPATTSGGTNRGLDLAPDDESGLGA